MHYVMYYIITQLQISLRAGKSNNMGLIDSSGEERKRVERGKSWRAKQELLPTKRSGSHYPNSF